MRETPHSPVEGRPDGGLHGIGRGRLDVIANAGQSAFLIPLSLIRFRRLSDREHSSLNTVGRS